MSHTLKKKKKKSLWLDILSVFSQKTKCTTRSAQLALTRKLWRRKNRKHSKSLQCGTAAGCTIETAFTPLPKNATDALGLPNYHSSSCFPKWPNWPKSGYSGPQNEPRQYQAFISGWQSPYRAALFYLGPGAAEVARVNRTFDPNRPAPGNWPKKSPIFPNTCPERSLVCCVGELSTDYSLSQNVKTHEESLSCESSESLQVPCKQQGVNTCKIIANWIILFFICDFQYLRWVQSFYHASCICRQNLDELGWKHKPWVNPFIPCLPLRHKM